MIGGLSLFSLGHTKVPIRCILVIQHYCHGVRHAWSDLISVLQPLIQNKLASLGGTDETSEYFKLNLIVLSGRLLHYVCMCVVVLASWCVFVVLWF